MKCRACGEKFSANMKSPGIGGFSSPGIFFIINVILISSFIVLVSKGLGMYAFFVGIGVLIGLGANLTSWHDAGIEMESNGTASKGLSCPSCGAKNRVYPWSL